MAQHAQQLGVTPTHLARASRTATFVAAAGRLTARLLDQTQTALIDAKQTAKDIATHMNFGSVANFKRFVQQHTGQPPT